MFCSSNLFEKQSEQLGLHFVPWTRSDDFLRGLPRTDSEFARLRNFTSL